MSKEDIQRIPIYLEHILEAINRIKHYTLNISLEEFLQDYKSQDAVIRNIEILGEASHNIERYHPSFANEHSEIPWSDLYWMRNRVSHGYFSVDLDIVWKTIQNDLPILECQILNIGSGSGKGG